MAIKRENIERYRANGLTEQGEMYIERVRSSPPARRVGGTRFLSVSCRFASQKMGCTIQAESRTGEYPLVLKLELDKEVIEYFDQPSQVLVERRRSGRRHVSAYTPDFLVLRNDRVEVIEVKPREVVEKAREKHPDEWAMRDGYWICLPVAAEFDQMGIPYRIHLVEDINAVEAANLNLLEAAHRLPANPNEAALLKRLSTVINADAVPTIQMVVADLALKDASIVLGWIAKGVLFAATSDQLLSDVRTARVFSDEDAVARFLAAKQIDAHPNRTPDANDQSAKTDEPPWIASEESNVIAEALTDRQLALALQRYTAALPAIQGLRTPSRTESRQIKRMRQGVSAGAGALQGFVPRHHMRGNRVPRITPQQEELMAVTIRDCLLTPARRSVRWVYASIAWESVPRVSYKSFLRFVRKTPKHSLAKARSGHRMALAARPQSHPDVRAIWPTRGWELVHIDHTPIDEKVWGQLGVAQILGRPWLTTMVDGWSGAILAFWLSFSPPSWESLAMLARDCVRRHRRLPSAWISDQGSEFGSIFWELFSANHGCTKVERAIADARCGSQVERSFHMIHQALIYQLDGNMQNDREWRSATTSHKSDANARFILEKIHTEIDRYLFDHHNIVPHGPNTFTPKQMLDQSDADLGLLGRRVEYDLSFRVETASRFTRQMYPVDSRRGLRVGKRIYWHSDFAQPKYDGVRVEVRREPFDSSLIYAHLDGTWIECITAKHRELKCLEEFGRWSQSAIDYYGKPYAAAIKREADERYVTRQRQNWARESNDPRENAVDPIDPATTAPAATSSTDQASPSKPSSQPPQASPTASPFDRLRDIEVKPLKGVCP